MFYYIQFCNQMNRKTLLQVFFRRDDQKFEYKRQVYTLFDSFAKIGGIFGILVAAIQIILKFFIENLFFSHMITRLYQLEDNHERIYLTDTSDYDQEDNKGIRLCFNWFKWLRFNFIIYFYESFS